MALEKSYLVIVDLVSKAREKAVYKVNEILIKTYYSVGKYIYENTQNASYGDAYVDGLAEYFKQTHPEFKGFTKRNLYRMRQFYEMYFNDEKMKDIIIKVSWSNHLKIMSSCKSKEERYFYLELCAKEQYSARTLARQIQSSYYERFMLSRQNKVPALENADGHFSNQLLDTYVLEFLNLPRVYDEKDLRKSIVHNLRKFITEISSDLTFIGEEYRIQVGLHDYFIDLLFYHRGLSCLVVFELKTGEFKPEYVGKMNFYLEALDRTIKKPNENPSVGVILCASKDDEIVEIALNRSLSPTMVSKYELNLIDKKLLKSKLKECMNLLDNKDDE